MLDSARVLVTGRFWVGADGARSIGPALTELMDKAKQEILIVAYRLTIAHDELRKSLESALARGCLVKVILNNSESPIEVERAYFNGLLQKYSTLTVWDFCESTGNRNVAMHAKLIAADRHTAVVGSANFSHNGLVENHEIAILVKGKPVRSLCAAVDSLIKEASKADTLIKRAGG